METLRIVEANPTYIPYFGGIERRMHFIAHNLAKMGHDVTVLSAQFPDTKAEEDTEYGYRIVRVPSKFINLYNPPYISSKGALDILNKIDPDIMNYNYRWAPSFDKDMANFSGKKVFTYHNQWGEGVGYQHFFSNINDNWYKKKLDRYDHIVAVAENIRTDLINRGYSPDKVTTIEYGLESVPERATEEKDFILNLGRLVPTKGLEYLIEAMQYVDQKLVLCGTGPEEKKLRKLVRKYGLEDRVEFRGFVEEEEKEELMRTCKFFVMPSLFETYGLAALEVISYGKPIVCTDVNGLPDNVQDAGYFVKPRDAKGLADAMNALLADPEMRRRKSDAGVRIAHSRTAEVQTKMVEDLYYRILNNE